MPNAMTRRKFFKIGGVTALGLAGTAAMVDACAPGKEVPAKSLESPTPTHTQHGVSGDSMFMPGFVGEVDHAANGFNPTDILTDFDYGKVSVLPNAFR